MSRTVVDSTSGRSFVAARGSAAVTVEELDGRRAYALLRLTTGLNLLLHGLVRLPNLSTFAHGLVTQFERTPLPAALVEAFGYTLTVVELGVGVSLLFGLWTRLGAMVGALTIAVLVFGTALRSDWNVLGTQMVYALVYYLLVERARFNSFSVDGWLRRRGSSPASAP